MDDWAPKPSLPTTRPLRVLELFCGIGGCAAALGERAEVVAAVDIDRTALAVYSHNFPHPVVVRTIESIPVAGFREWGADLWWMSPPCRPYMERGARRDLEDSRAESFENVVRALDDIRPRHLALENVVGFCNSRAHAFLRSVLERRGYHVAERVLCPTELGVCNRRPRFYLVASRGPLLPWPTWRAPSRPLAAYLDPFPPQETFVAPATIEQYATAVDLVHPDAPDATAACFTSSYGRSIVRSGSYLVTGGRIRRFAPAEIVRLLGFPESFRLPPSLALHEGWRLVGNSLSVAAVLVVLSAIPELSIQD